MKLISFVDANPPERIEINGGLWITLTSLQQWLTYEGLLIGFPSPDINEARKDDALRIAVSRFGVTPRPYLIEPAPINFTMQTQRSKLTRGGQLEPAGAIEIKAGERLPLVTCIAKFRSSVTTNAVEGAGLFAYSTATLVWFQETFALPIPKEIIAEIRNLRWEMISADVSD